MSLGMWVRVGRIVLSLKNRTTSLLMWDMRRNLDPTPLPPRRCTINFLYPDVKAAKRSWWLVVDAGTIDLCSSNPGFDIDLYVRTSLRSMTAVWMGLSSVQKEVDAGQIELIGDPNLAQSMQRWLGLSVFAKPRRATA